MALYSPAILQYRRRKTREVMVGDVGIGGQNPIRVQSMTIADTKDTEAVVQETKDLVEVGCEIVRITAPTIHHAENLKEIKRRLRQDGIKVPLVADIHFTPQAAMIAADHVEKVRVNPGNYADRKLFAVKEYTDSEYESELQRMAEKFIPLVRKCKTNGVAMRIGTNHGSLSDRIMNRYGDTPEGMVESALEFVRICESENYYDIVLSMKASSPFIMIAAYRLLAERMNALGMDYPFHLGVTEAGEGEDGRIKSAVGIGSLLEDGIGDTIRVSLTEDSIHEIPVAQQLVQKFNFRDQNGDAPHSGDLNITWNPIVRERRHTNEIKTHQGNLGEKNTYRVMASVEIEEETSHLPEEIENYLQQTQKEEIFCDVLYLKSTQGLKDLATLRTKILKLNPKILVGVYAWVAEDARQALEDFDAVVFPVGSETTSKDLTDLAEQAHQKNKILDLRFPSASAALDFRKDLKKLPSTLISLDNPHPIHEYRKLALGLDQEKITHPIHLYVDASQCESAILEGSSALGALLVDGIGDTVEVAHLPLIAATTLAFNTLQATRLRISKAEFIACPSCGRTLFDLQETTQRIKSKTAHLKGVKIAIMGCIVNGPGEMADADFGYVGGGPGKIHLYVGKDCVEKNIPTAIADEKLIELIKKHDRWVDPPL